MATKTKAKKPKKRVRPSAFKQEVLEEMKPIRNDTLEAKAQAYVMVRDQRMELTRQEVACKTELLNAMKEAKEEMYETEDGLVVEITHKDVEDLKVSRRSAGENGEA